MITNHLIRFECNSVLSYVFSRLQVDPSCMWHAMVRSLGHTFYFVDSAGEEDNTDSDPEALSPPKPMKELVPTFPCLADLTREEYDDMFPCLADVYPAHEQWADSESSGEDPNTDSDPKVENEKDFAKSKDSVGEEHNTDSNPKATIPIS
ncbi:hypothetical protein L195_g025072 [Trifolium pratense]|uniref:Uncharacterized protein n=1 Tax=Trifolium pratense TaxID=57577 RepID=A0A2K3NFG4_TRIPR|nr:hypothetical protein L195_g025072 [Trifolium pratense]